LIPRKILVEQYRSWSSSLCSFIHSPFFLVPLRPKYSPEHAILKHPYPTYFPQCLRPSFTPTETNWPNYISVYLNLYTLYIYIIFLDN
jgi:hypothetical protein